MRCSKTTKISNLRGNRYFRERVKNVISRIVRSYYWNESKNCETNKTANNRSLLPKFHRHWNFKLRKLRRRKNSLVFVMIHRRVSLRSKNSENNCKFEIELNQKMDTTRDNEKLTYSYLHFYSKLNLASCYNYIVAIFVARLTASYNEFSCRRLFMDATWYHICGTMNHERRTTLVKFVTVSQDKVIRNKLEYNNGQRSY